MPYKCPKCGNTDRLAVEVRTWATLIQEADGNFQTDTTGDDQPDYDHYWDDDSQMMCRECDHEDTVKRFRRAAAA